MSKKSKTTATHPHPAYGDAVTTDNLGPKSTSSRTEMQTRRQRRDRGIMQCTPRDLTVLTWIGEQYAVRFDHLQRLLAHQPGKSLHLPEVLGAATTSDLVARWHRAGLVETERLAAHTPRWVWLTRAGLTCMNLAYLPYRPRLAALSHLHAINAVRMRIESHYGPTACWQSERALRSERGFAKRNAHQPHLPDALLALESEQDAQTIAVEVELSLKSPDHLAAILHELSTHYPAVWYFALPQIMRGLERAFETLDPQLRRVVRLYPFDALA